MFRAYYSLIQIEIRSRNLLKILVAVVRLTARAVIPGREASRV